MNPIRLRVLGVLTCVAACGPAATRVVTQPAAATTPRSPVARATAGEMVAPISTSALAALDLDPLAAISPDPRDDGAATREELLALFPKAPPSIEQAIDFLAGAHPNQGNQEVASHDVSKRACLEGLRGTVLQTPEQRARCGGAEYMVPVFDHGDPASAKFCIDVFEFPNLPCELPVVWLNPMQANAICKAQGKRLCDEKEWNLACRADPAGGPDRVYAYGDDLDLTICNTDKSRVNKPRCDLANLDAMWRTCATDTEPAGAFPKCRSRFGVYDQHGNVAEIMSQVDWDGITYDQLKGSAFFYTDVKALPNKWTDRNTYPDHCNFKPVWHKEKLSEAAHVNYHLGFRCCRDI